MSRRVEVRARLEDLEELRSRVEALASPTEESAERETFFESPNGQLKLVRSEVGAELVYREAAGGDLASEAQLMKSTVGEPAEIEAILSAACGVLDAIEVRRQTYRVDEAHVSLDRVDGLGDFIELSVEVTPQQSSAAAWNSAVDLAEKLGLEPSRLISASYADLLADSE